MYYSLGGGGAAPLSPLIVEVLLLQACALFLCYAGNSFLLCFQISLLCFAARFYLFYAQILNVLNGDKCWSRWSFKGAPDPVAREVCCVLERFCKNQLIVCHNRTVSTKN